MKEKAMRWIKGVRTQSVYKDFIESIKTGDNKKIEENEVVKLFDFMIENGSNFEKELPENEMLYRARKIYNIEELGVVKDESQILSGFDRSGSKEPPLSITKEGRCNPEGVSYLYVAEDKYTACAEVKPAYFDFISVATFKTKKKMKIIDFSEDKSVKDLNESIPSADFYIGRILTWAMMQFAGTTGDFANYTISQFISDYFRKAGYNGLAYKSSQTNKTCYVIFSSHISYIDFISSEVCLADRSVFSYVELKTEKHLPQEVDEKLTQEEIRNIVESFKRERRRQ